MWKQLRLDRQLTSSAAVSLILVAELDPSAVATCLRRPTSLRSSSAWVEDQEVEEMAMEMVSHSNLWQMEVKQRWLDFNVVWTLVWPRRHLQPPGSPRRPISRTGGDWIFLVANVYDGARRLLWKELTWWCLNSRMWLGMLLKASTMTTSSWTRTPSSLSRRSWMSSFNTKKKLNVRNDVKSSLSSSAETKEKNYKPIWWDTRHWWGNSKTWRLRYRPFWRDGTCWQGLEFHGGRTPRWKHFVEEISMFRMWPRRWPECLEVTASQTPRTRSFATREMSCTTLSRMSTSRKRNETQEVYYYDEADEWPEDEMDEIDFVGCDDEEISAEIDEASIAVEDAYINYLDSRKKMRELALARGFYPVVALDMGGSAGSGGKGGQKGSSKSGGGKGKGKKSGKGHGKSFQPPGARRYVYGARRGKGGQAGTPSYNDQTAPKSTASGSTGQHGPRFKRYRLPASGIKEVPDDVQMVTDMEQVPITKSIYEEINAMDTAVGWAIMDSGATRSVCGEAVWNQISDYLLMRGLADKIDVQGENRDFRFGDGVVVRSKVSARIPVCIAKQWKELTLHVLPGETPLLLARPDLERWNTVVDYGNKVVRVDGVAVKPAYTSNGHYMLNIFDDLQDVLNVEDFVAKKEDDEETTFVNSMITDDISDMEYDLEVAMDEGVVEESIYTAVHNSEEHNRVLKFWEAYVDEGRLGQYLASIGDVQVSASLCQIGTSAMKINGRSSGGWQSKKNLTTSWWHPSVVCGPPCRTSTTRRQSEKKSWRIYESWRSTTTCSSTRTSTMMGSASAMTPLWSNRPMGCHGRLRHWNQWGATMRRC